jgi:hypothetical protein
MKPSIDRIFVSHAGSLPRPDDLREMLIARDGGQPCDQQEFTRRVPERGHRGGVQAN